MPRRSLSNALAAVLVVVALASAGAAVLSLPVARGAQASAGQSPTPVLSARRVPSLLAETLANERLDKALDAVFADPAYGGAPQASCMVVRDDRGHPVYERRPGLALQPASNLKLLTATAALSRLGPTARFRTEVRAVARPGGGVLAGDLWLVGGGDPLLATADFASVASFEHGPRLATAMEALADSIAHAGIHQVQGRVVGDESRYDAVRYVPSWEPEYVSDHEVGPISALSVNQGFVRWAPPVDAPRPATNAAAVLVGLLKARGVAVVGGAAEGPAPATATAMWSIDSPPLSDVVGEMLKESDNATAEMLVKELGFRFGGHGSWAAGLAVVRQAVAGVGMPVAGIVLADGSGLDRSDRVTCADLEALLEQAGPQGTLTRDLPLAGKDGTLVKRFVGTPAAGRVRAKTGHLKDVVSLSGWADGQQGRRLSFSMIADALPRQSVGFGLQDRLASALVQYPQAPPAATLGPQG